MKKVVSTLCDNCESDFSLSFNENLVKEHDEIFCPFCGENIESVEEDIPEEEDYLEQEGIWD
jgi:hypothetical protein